MTCPGIIGTRRAPASERLNAPVTLLACRVRGQRRLANAAMISIVDDDKSVRSATRTLLECLGYTTATFASEFLQSGRLRETDRLIADAQMPGMSGLDLQNHLIASGDTTPVIFITGFPDESLRKRALSAGAFGFLTKPFTEQSLRTCLNRALARRLQLPEPSDPGKATGDAT